MAQYNSLNVKLSNSQLNKLNSAIKNETEAVLRLSSNMVGDDEKYIPHKLLLTNRQVANFRKGFANYLSIDIKLPKTQICKWYNQEDFLVDLLQKTGLPLRKNAIKPLAKSVLILLGLTAVASAANAGIHKKISGSERTSLIISNDEMKETLLK